MGFKVWVFILPALILSCKAGERESSGPIFCTIETTTTYQLGTDPGIDFDVTNLQKDTVFTNADCPNINTEAFSTLISRVKRVGSTVSIIEREFSSTKSTIELTAAGTSLLPLENSVSINGCTIKRRKTGTINSPGTTIDINESITYRGNCESTFLEQE